MDKMPPLLNKNLVLTKGLAKFDLCNNNYIVDKTILAKKLANQNWLIVQLNWLKNWLTTPLFIRGFSQLANSQLLGVVHYDWYTP